MTSEEHYREAEMWLNASAKLDFSDPTEQRKLELIQQRALIHATLATTPFEQIEVIQR